MKNYRFLFYAILAILTLIRLYFITLFELAPDEAYYWTWSRHLDWSYYDQGPMLALVIRFFTELTGQSTEFSVRLGSVVLSVVTSYLTFLLAKTMYKSERIGFYAFIGMQTALLFSAGAILMMHDSIMICLWMATLYFFYRALIQNWTPGWIFGSLMLGCGGLSKYTMALLVPCLLVFLIISPEHRKWWKKPHLYLSGLMTLLIVSPILVWNHIHGWASFGHISDLGGVSKKAFSLNFKTVGDYIGGQLAVMSPILGAFCLAAPVIGFKQWQKNKADINALFLASFSAPILFFFFIMSFQTQVYANWPAAAYPAALIFLAAWYTNLSSTKTSRKAKIWFYSAICFAALISVVVHLEVSNNILHLKGRAAHSVDRIRGWREVGLETARLLKLLEEKEKTKPFLAARRYQYGGILSFYTPAQPDVQLFGKNQPMKNQYEFWDRSDQLVGSNAVFVCEEEWEVNHVRQFFQYVEEQPQLVVKRDNRIIRNVRFCFAYNLLPKTGDKK